MDAAVGFDLDAEIIALMQRQEVQVPPFPAVVAKLIALTRTGDFGLDEVAKLVTADQVLTATVIRCANSAFYSGASPSTTVLQALQRIGTKDLIGVALAGALKAEASKTGSLFLLRRTCWQRGVTHALVAQTLARNRGLTEADAFLCGLLHDFGELIALSCIEQLLRKHQGKALDESVWAEIVERYHVELGLVTAAHWKLPALVVDAISSHHFESDNVSDHPKMVALMKACDAVVPLILASPHLSEEQLLALPGLERTDVDILLKKVPEIPPLLATFDTEGARPTKPAEPSRLTPSQEEVLTPPVRDISWLVTAKTGGDSVETYRAEQISTAGLRMRGKARLAERHALEVTLDLVEWGPLSMWVQVKSCVSDGADVVIEWAPFALDKAKARTWVALAKGRASTPKTPEPAPVEDDA